MGTGKPVRVTKADRARLARVERQARRLADDLFDELFEFGDWVAPHAAVAAAGRLLERSLESESGARQGALDDLAIQRTMDREQQKGQ